MTDGNEPEAIAPKYTARQLYLLGIKVLHPDPNQPRKHIDDNELKELANSIKKHGVLQPILFRCNEEGKLLIVSGERRFQASKIAKLETIPAIYIDGSTAEIALIENMLRVDLTPIEEAEGLHRLQTEAGYSNKELAAVIGKAESTISEILSLNKLPDKIRNNIRNSKDFSKRQLVEVAKGKDDKEANKLFKFLLKQNPSSDSLREKRYRDVEAVFKTMINGLTTKLKEVDFSNLDETKCGRISEQLKKLCSLIGEKVH